MMAMVMRTRKCEYLCEFRYAAWFKTLYTQWQKRHRPNGVQKLQYKYTIYILSTSFILICDDMSGSANALCNVRRNFQGQQVKIERENWICAGCVRMRICVYVCILMPTYQITYFIEYKLCKNANQNLNIVRAFRHYYC